MWFLFLKKNIVLKKNILINILKNIKEKKIFSKNLTLFNKNINMYLQLQSHNNVFTKPNVCGPLNFYIKTIIKNKKNQVDVYTNSLILKIKKKQLYSIYSQNNAVKTFFTNGIILNKLNIKKKSQKKDNKISIITIKKTLEKIYLDLNKNLIVNINGTKNGIMRVVNVLRNNIKNINVLYIYTPRINFSRNKFKKIKSIKRKLKKRYVTL